MARPIKDGVDYFPKDTDFYEDDKVRLLRAEFGAKGMYVLDYILCDLYGKNGYFINWNKNKCFLVSDGAGCGCTPEFIGEFIDGCVRCSFFDERVFDMFGILTSTGIQRRYIRMFKSREEIQILNEYWLLDIEEKKDVPPSILNKITFKELKSTGNLDKSTGNPDKSTGNAQSKKKDTNVSKKKDTNVSKSKFSFEIAQEIKEEWEAYFEMRKMIKRPLTDYSSKLAINKLETLAPSNYDLQKQILNQSTFNSYQGLFELKATPQDKGGNNNAGSNFKPSRSR